MTREELDEHCKTCQHYYEDQSEYHWCHICFMEYDCYKPNIAYVVTIDDITPIEEYDRVELAHVAEDHWVKEVK